MAAARRKRVSVTFAGDDEVLQHIYPINERKISLKAKRKATKKAVEDDLSSSDQENDTKDEEFRPSEVLPVEKDAIAGSDVFGFQTPKKRGQLAQKVMEMVTTPTSATRSSESGMTPKKAGTPRTPSSAAKATPTRAGRLQNTASSQVVNSGTPRRTQYIRKARLLGERKVTTSTPYRLSSRHKPAHGTVSSDEDSMCEDESEESDIDENVRPLDKSGKATPGKSKATPHSATASPSSARATPGSSTATPSSSRTIPGSSRATPGTPRGGGNRARRRVQDEEQAELGTDHYFDLHSGAPGLTSDRTLARLETPRMDPGTLQDTLSGISVGYIKERASLYDEYRVLFHKWMYQLCNGYNLVLHGLGSKIKLMDEFRQQMLKDFTHIVINGYFPSITIKGILNSITEDVLEHRGSFRSLLDQCDFIRQQYDSGDSEDFYLIIHNIDGAMLRAEKAQAVLSNLAQIQGFHIIASIDHINAPLVWDQSKMSRFNWVWYDVTTFEPYVDETSYENSLLVQQSGALALSSLTHVMRSLTPNAKGIFYLLAQYQLDNKDNTQYIGMSHPDLYRRCREAYLVNSELTLRSQLTEFKDHKLVKVKKGYDGVEHLEIPLDAATLKEFLDNQDDT